MPKHTILFLAANPHGTSQLRLGEECAEIQRELKMAPHRDDFRFESRWAVSIDELMRHLMEADPSVIHFSGHGGGSAGLLFQDEQGRRQPVSARALAMMVEAAARRPRVIVLNACYSAAQAEALRSKVDCVVGMDGAIGDEAARAFAIRFYGALGNRRSVGNAVAQGVAALAAKQLPDELLPCCATRNGVEASKVFLEPFSASPRSREAPGAGARDALPPVHQDQNRFDALLCYESGEESVAVELATQLRNRGLNICLDVRESRPGAPRLDAILEALKRSNSCVVLIGRSAQSGRDKTAAETIVDWWRHDDFPFIPVLLPGAPDRSGLGAFLRLFTWVDLRAGTTDPEAIDRLVWGITGLRPAERQAKPPATEPHPDRAASARFHIETPKNGDFLFGPFNVSGTGPARTRVCVYYRSPDMKQPQLWGGTESDDTGRWEVLGPMEFVKMRPRPYELHAAGALSIVEDHLPSQAITVFYRDTISARRVARKLSLRHRFLEIGYELHTAFLEATKLKKGRQLLSRRLATSMEECAATAAAAGDEIAARLRELVARPPLDVRITIDRDRRVHLDPSTAWASYYAFPWVADPSSDANKLSSLRTAQNAWRLTSHVDQIPKAPFEQAYDAASTYLEVRHDGYRPEFVPLKHVRPRTFTVHILPVLHKRIAVLDFPCEDPDGRVSSLSQLIAQEIADAIESQPELGTFAYFSDTLGNASSMDFFEKLGRPPIEMGNEVLTLRDVQAVQAELESVDIGMVSGEGRHLLRKALDIQFLVRGSYRVFNHEEA
ncbi:MAG TPA: TIR domain-containing protein [Kofleriaceae bacterium]